MSKYSDDYGLLTKNKQLETKYNTHITVHANSNTHIWLWAKIEENFILHQMTCNSIQYNKRNDYHQTNKQTNKQTLCTKLAISGGTLSTNHDKISSMSSVITK
jgi:hypothetical protein